MYQINSRQTRKDDVKILKYKENTGKYLNRDRFPKHKSNETLFKVIYQLDFLPQRILNFFK
jgi:hypothetical protein